MQEVDIVGPPLLVSGLRGTVLDYAGLCTTDDPVLVTPIPNEETSTLVTIFKPFTIEVWVIVLASLLLTATAITVASHFSSFPGKNNATKQDLTKNFGNFLLYLVAILANQGSC